MTNPGGDLDPALAAVAEDLDHPPEISGPGRVDRDVQRVTALAHAQPRLVRPRAAVEDAPTHVEELDRSDRGGGADVDDPEVEKGGRELQPRRLPMGQDVHHDANRSHASATAIADVHVATIGAWPLSEWQLDRVAVALDFDPGGIRLCRPIEPTGTAVQDLYHVRRQLLSRLHVSMLDQRLRQFQLGRLLPYRSRYRRRPSGAMATGQDDVAHRVIEELKNALSAYLSEVREGAEDPVTDHGQPIARIVPPTATSEQRLADQVARGEAWAPGVDDRRPGGADPEDGVRQGRRRPPAAGPRTRRPITDPELLRRRREALARARAARQAKRQAAAGKKAGTGPGAGLVVDGYFGPATEAALRAAQSRQHITAMAFTARRLATPLTGRTSHLPEAPPTGATRSVSELAAHRSPHGRIGPLRPAGAGSTRDVGCG
jgi:antitoxin (DNA-binding transcriptional repressor) of toxin-antitoxin stability system